MIRPTVQPAGFRHAARLTLWCGLSWLLLGLAHAQGADRSSVFRSPGPGEALVPGSHVEILWSPHCQREDDRVLDEAELVLSLDGGITFPIRISGEISPCASRFQWRVPALPSSSARLGLRIGEKGWEEAERIDVLSAPFAILPDPEGRPERLYARGVEWWTLPTPANRSAEDLLEETVGEADPHIMAPERWTEANQTSPLAEARPAMLGWRADLGSGRLASNKVQSFASRMPLSTPLRL